MGKTTIESESHKTKVDNGVHPLHQATSPGPSPMGTDPINLFKMVQKWFWTLQINFSSTGKSLQDLFSGLIQIGLQKQRKAKQNREDSRLFTITATGH